MDIATGRTKRLIVEMPPRHGKSELVSKYFPAWYLGMHPRKNVILASATDSLAADFSGAVRDLLNEFGQQYFGVSVKWDRQALQNWRTTAEGGMLAAGIGGDIMGRGADLLIIDDFFKNAEEALSESRRQAIQKWYLSTSSTRLSPEGATVIVATRWHKDDLIGGVLKTAAETGEHWERIRFSALAEEDNDALGRRLGEALWPSQFPQELLLKKKRSYHAAGYPWMWEALYQQNPPDILDSEFPADYFGEHIWFSDWPADSEIICKVIAVDPSLGKTDKSDYSAIVMLAKDVRGGYWIDADLKRRDSTRIAEDAIAAHHWFHPVALGCEKNQFQELVGKEIEREAAKVGMNIWPLGIDNHVPKITRIRSLTPLLAQRRLSFRRGSPGVALLVEQLKGFPSCKFDDGPDALEMAVRLCENILGGLTMEEPDQTEYLLA